MAVQRDHRTSTACRRASTATDRQPLRHSRRRTFSSWSAASLAARWLWRCWSPSRSFSAGVVVAAGEGRPSPRRPPPQSWQVPGRRRRSACSARVRRRWLATTARRWRRPVRRRPTASRHSVTAVSAPPPQPPTTTTTTMTTMTSPRWRAVSGFHVMSFKLVSYRSPLLRRRQRCLLINRSIRQVCLFLLIKLQWQTRNFAHINRLASASAALSPTAAFYSATCVHTALIA